MNKMINVIKYQLMTFRTQTILCFSVVGINLLISLIVQSLTSKKELNSGTTAGSIDIIALIWILIIGLSYFSSSFKLMLSNGVSRKRFFWGNILSFTIISAVWAAAIVIFIMICRSITSIAFVLFEVLYKDASIVGAAIWMFAALFMIAILGWLIFMLYYRSSKQIKIVITLLPFVLIGLFIVINHAYGGVLFNTLYKFLTAVMGLSGNIHNPYTAAFSMLLFGAVLSRFNFLLIRRAQIKE